jgi:hypothetical protein
MLISIIAMLTVGSAASVTTASASVPAKNQFWQVGGAKLPRRNEEGNNRLPGKTQFSLSADRWKMD